MPVVVMICPSCGHKYNLPTKEAKAGFKHCPKCGHKEQDEHNPLQ